MLRMCVQRRLWNWAGYLLPKGLKPLVITSIAPLGLVTITLSDGSSLLTWTLTMQSPDCFAVLPPQKLELCSSVPSLPAAGGSVNLGVIKKKT